MELATSFWRWTVMHSLHFRLLAAFALVIIITIGSGFLFTYQTTRSEIGRFGERVEMMRARRVEIELATHYYHQRGWEGVQPLAAQLGNFYGGRIILTDNDGVVDTLDNCPWRRNTDQARSGTCILTKLERPVFN